MSDSALLRPEPLPVERILFDGSVVRVGSFRCPTTDPLFADSGPIVNPIFVFPRTGVWIEHEGQEPFVADPTIATLYNRGQLYRRRPLSRTGDSCDWFAVSPPVLAEIASARSPRIDPCPEQPFPRPQAPIDSRTYLFQRQLVETLERGTSDPLFVEEQVIWLASQVAHSLADALGLREAARRPASRRHREQAEQTRQVLAHRFRQSCSLEDLAASVGVSVFHLCRVFRQHTGLTLHEYRIELRLRHALELLPARTADLTEIALELGFSSHSHFTAAFRRRFGVTPSAFARQGKAPFGGEHP